MPRIESVDIRLFTNYPEDRQGFETAVCTLLLPILPERENFSFVLDGLLNEREGIETDDPQVRGTALGYLHKWTGIITDLFQDNPFPLPSVFSRTLIDEGIITNKTSIRQITSRDKGRGEKGKGPSENRVILRQLARKERDNMPMEFRQKLSDAEADESEPLVLIEEYYTTIVPTAPNIERTFKGQYLIGQTKSGEPIALFIVEEPESPHLHKHIEEAGKEIRIDKETDPDLISQIEEEIPLPEPQQPRKDFLVTNEQLATLLVLIRHSVIKEEIPPP